MNTNSLRIALAPLDERPVNTRYPQMLGQIAGAEVLLPPSEALGLQREPADLPVITQWLRDTAPTTSGAIVSCDYLGYGNLINARISQDSAAAVLGRLSILEEIGARIPVHAFSLITRVANADNCVEEPLYWEKWGTRFYRWARLTHQSETSLLPPEDRVVLKDLDAQLPPDLKADWLMRRLRNHTVNLGLIDLAARGKVASLLLTSDDTAAYGFPSRERDWLRGWPRLIGPALSSRLHMYPGADEVGSALAAQLINAHHGRAPLVWVEYAIPGDEEYIAPYEDRPVRETVLGQISACGCVLAECPEESDFILGVVTPSPRRTDYRLEYAEEDRRDRTAPYLRFIARLAGWQARGLAVAVGDVAYPNGGDPLFSDLLLDPASALRPGGLAAYGAWNTAGNTLGVVVAQAVCALYIEDNAEQAEAQKRFLAHRFLEDWGYQTVARRAARDIIEQSFGRRDPDPNSLEQIAETRKAIEEQLTSLLTRLQQSGVGEGLTLVPGSARLPWRRTFEVDFDLS
ncbi:hypothetical protein CCAX7_001130 [Capsulimonas corticalis]|uniref:Uncharacterized protein n=1 Tax=Capsulimonas corticalis TaxID=2219043 RepID=A0A402CRQ5_9BACT|nr:DUF4127 family protein [Capsulimonas corticalis]BDI28062.1 hypothetical protein CCAX7_001130 [Capsulimonas corticalis]